MLTSDTFLASSCTDAVFEGYAIVVGSECDVQCLSDFILKSVDAFGALVYAMAALPGQHPVVVCYRFGFGDGFQS